MLTRYASAASSSVFVTFALLFVMQFLITQQQGNPVEDRTRWTLKVLELVRPDTRVHPEEFFQKEDLTNAVDPPPRQTYTGPKESIHVPRMLPKVPAGTGLPVFGEFTDGSLVAMVRVAPVYPARALAQEIEGYVIVRFDVTVNGLVTNVDVVESSNRMFDKAAIKAAEKFKFKPRIVDGVAYESYGIQNLFRFALDD